MICPFCQQRTRIYNSRSTHNKTQTWRRHQCRTCGKTFTTREKIDWTGQTIVITPSGKAPYERERLLMSIVRASKHINTPPSMMTELTDSIEQELQKGSFFTGNSQSCDLIVTTATTVLARYNTHMALQYVTQVFNNKPPLELIRALTNP